MNCVICNIEFISKRTDAKTCSPKCRKLLHNKRSIGTDNGTDNVILDEPKGTDNLVFKFTTKYTPINNSDNSMVDKYKVIRQATYWYDVPLSALPVIEKGHPQMPGYMNGRQYFLWWKNEFKVNDKEEPIILNPFPTYDKVEYFKAGDGSRRWGA